MKTSVWQLNVAEAICWIAMSALVAGFVLDAPPIALWPIASIVLASGAFLALGDVVRALAVLPAPALLGPIVRVSAGPILLHLGDAFLGILTIALVIQMVRRPIAPFASRVFFVAFSFLVLLSWLFSLDAVTSVTAIVGMAQLLVALLLTLHCVRTRDDVRRIMLGWIGAVALSCIVVLVAFLEGRSLLLGQDAEQAANIGAKLVAGGLLFRATFFVTPFIFPLVSAVLLTMTLVLLDEGGTRQRLLLLSLLPLLAVTGIALGNLSVGVGTMVGATGLLLWSLTFQNVVRRTLWLMTGAVAIGLIVAVVLAQVGDSDQLQLLRDRVKDPTSFEQRLAVWRNVTRYLLETPRAFLLGIGPDISIRTPDIPLLRPIWSVAGVYQNAVDSGYLYGALNFGVPAVLVALLAALTVLWRLSRGLLRRPDALALALWVALVAWLVMCITQQHGIGKPVLFLAQALALAERLPPQRSRA